MTKCKNCGKIIEIDQEGDWIHKYHPKKVYDWRFCYEKGIAGTFTVAEPIEHNKHSNRPKG